MAQKNESKYQVIERSILNSVEKHIYAPGQRIESETELCEKYGASRITIRRALDELCRAGILYKKQGAGTYVRKNAVYSIPHLEKQTILVITPFFSRLMTNIMQLYLPEIYKNIDNSMYSVATLMEPGKFEKAEDFAENIRKQNAVGIIYYYFERKDVLQVLTQLQIPVVLVDIAPADNPFDLVTGEDFESAYRMVISLLAQGIRRIGFFSQYGPGMSTSDLREAGIRQALLDNNIPLNPNWFFNQKSDSNLDSDWLKDETEAYLLKNKDLEAVITANDDSAFPLLGSARELKIQVPDQLKVISYGNYSLGDLSIFNLTSFEQNLSQYATEAAKLLMKRIHGELPNIQQKRVIKYRLVRRGTY